MSYPDPTTLPNSCQEVTLLTVNRRSEAQHATPPGSLRRARAASTSSSSRALKQECASWVTFRVFMRLAGHGGKHERARKARTPDRSCGTSARSFSAEGISKAPIPRCRSPRRPVGRAGASLPRALKGREPATLTFHLSMRLCGARRGHGKGTEGTDPGRGGALVRALLLRRGHMRDPRPPLSESQTPCCEERSISSCRGQKLWNSWGEANFARADAFQIALVAKRTP
jgi:hypothetical protein